MTGTQSIDSLSIQQALTLAEKTLNSCSDSAKLDAQVLLSFVLKKDISYFFTWPEKLIESNLYLQYQALIEQRQLGKPVAYLVGNKEFWSLDLAVAPSTLIPRPDTETLVELVIEKHSDISINKSKSLSCLDLGTGTGAIALALASEMPDWHIEAVDYNDDAVELANKNAKKHQLNHVKIYQSNWFDNVEHHQSFDIIVSNPPYIDESDHHLNEGDVRFEPNSALVASEQGYSDLFIIIVKAKAYFTQHGYLYLEHGFEQAQTVQKYLREHGYVNIHTQQDLSGNDRVTYAEFLN